MFVFTLPIVCFGNITSITADYLLGDAFIIKKTPQLFRAKLEEDGKIETEFPYTLATPKDSFLEITFHEIENISRTLRIGRGSALEIKNEYQFYMFKGTFLHASRDQSKTIIESNQSRVTLEGSGTFIAETTPIGFKIIILEGDFETYGTTSSKTITSGELALITDSSGKISDPMQIELLLLLNTSRLITQFPKLLPTHTRLLSAAKVQSMRMKTKYDAFIGGVSENEQLRIWKVGRPE